MTRGKWQTYILFIVMLIVALFPPYQLHSASSNSINQSSSSFHNPIHINGDSQFTQSNGVVAGIGTESDPYIIADWSINTTSAHGIWIENSNAHFIITNCYIHNSTNKSSLYYGIYFKNVRNGTIENNKINFNYFGIYFLDSNSNRINNNILNNNNRGISFTNSDLNIISNNIISFNSRRGIFIWDHSDNNIIINNKINTCNDSGLTIDYYSTYNKIYNNIFNKSKDNGIFINRYSTNNIISNNKCSNNECGIFIHRSDLNFIENNICLNNSREGIFVDFFSDSNTVNNNTVVLNDKGIYIEHKCYSNKFINNTIENNDKGFYLEYKASLNTIANNTIKFNKYGINITSYNSVSFFGPCINNTIYNNYFNNSDNYDVDVESTNIWNISKTLGRNIIGGPYLGGNYWSDYKGRDTDEDGLGDTAIPFGPGDHHPLSDIYFPGIMDNTTGIPTTGDEFTFNATAWDDIIVRNVQVEYWCDQGSHKNLTMNRTSGDLKNGTYSVTTNVSANASKLDYNVSVVDTGSNWVSSSRKTLEVIDNDKPSITDITSLFPTTGDNFIFNVTALDNIHVSEVYVRFWFDDDIPENITLTPNMNYYESPTIVPPAAKNISYIISAVDNSGNWAARECKILDVMDDDDPELIDLSGAPTTGEEYTFSFAIFDNIELSAVYLEYWFDEMDHSNITLQETNSYFTTIPIDAYTLHAVVTAVDTSDNIKQLEINKPVMDNDHPIIDDLTTGQPETGNEFLIKCAVVENHGIKNISLEYWFDESEHILDSMKLEANNYSLQLKVPVNVEIMQYIITIEDTSNNSVNVDNKLIVIDIILPEIHDLTEGVPTTGDDFEIKAVAEDNIAVQQIFLEYWFDYSEHANVTFNNVLIINVSSDAKTLHYILSATDSAGNVKSISNEIDVTDNDAPVILESTLEPTTGDYLEFEAEITDNIMLISSNLEYWFDEHERTKINYDGFYSIFVPANAEVLHYNITAEDAEGNTAYIERTLNVIDNDEPLIIDLSPKIATTGETFNVSAYIKDNLLVSGVKIEYWYWSEHFRDDMKYVGNNYNISIQVPENATELSYMINASDFSGNIRILEKNISVKDNDEPVIIDHSSISEDGFVFSVEAEDNIGISEIKVEFRFDNGSIEYYLLHLNEGMYQYIILVPEDAEKLYYTISVVDTSGNGKSTEEMEIELPKTEEPVSFSKTSEKGPPWIIFAIIILLILILMLVSGYYLYVRKKRARQESPAKETTESSVSPGQENIEKGSSATSVDAKPIDVIKTGAPQPVLTPSVLAPIHSPEQALEVPNLSQLPPAQIPENKADPGESKPEETQSSQPLQQTPQVQQPKVSNTPTVAITPSQTESSKTESTTHILKTQQL